MCDFLTPVPPLECKGTPQTAVDGRFPETTAESLQIQPTHQQRNFNGQVLTKLEQIEQELKNTCHTLATQHTNLNTSTSQSICLYIIHLLPQHPKTSQDIPRHFRQQQARHPRNAAHDSDDWFRCESHPRWGDESAPWADSPGHGIMGPREHQVTGGSTWRKKTFFSASWIFGKGDMHIDFFSGIWN
jgi:hypothetical protein